MPPQQFTSCFQRHDEVLTELEKATKRSRKLETVYKEFELQKVCYLPLNTFLLKPIQRLVHYRLLLQRLCGHHAPGHHDYADCRGERAAVPREERRGQTGRLRLPYWGGSGCALPPGGPRLRGQSWHCSPPSPADGAQQALGLHRPVLPSSPTAFPCSKSEPRVKGSDRPGGAPTSAMGVE